MAAAPNRARQERIATHLKMPASQFMFGDPNHKAKEPISAAEVRLIKAFRSVLSEDKAKFLADIERRAREVEEIELRVRTERGLYQAAAPRRVATVAGIPLGDPSLAKSFGGGRSPGIKELDPVAAARAEKEAEEKSKQRKRTAAARKTT